MRMQDIRGMIESYFIIAFVGVVILTAIFCIAYFFLYKNMLRGKKRLSFSRGLGIIVLVGYLLMVLAATFFTRQAYDLPEVMISLSIFTHYLEAWNHADLRAWQMIIFNILMFVPFGALLPSLFRSFRNPFLTLLCGLFFTGFIEVLQLVTRTGVFETADILNNWLGALLGYCLAMLVIICVESRKGRYGKNESMKSGKIPLSVKTIALALPILLVVGGFTATFAAYAFKEYGNMSLAPSYILNCEDASFTSKVELSSEPAEAVVYKAETYDKVTGLKRAKELFQNLGMEYKNIETTQYNDNALYKAYGHSGGSIWLQYRSGTYWYTSYGKYDVKAEDSSVGTINKEEALVILSEVGIQVPPEAEYDFDDLGRFTFKLKPVANENHYISGDLSAEVAGDGTLMGINSDIIAADTYKRVMVMSQMEAAEEIRMGRFQSYDFKGKKIESIEITGVVQQNYLDTKGFLQPVYKFTCLINGVNKEVLIPARRT